jgi:hypothetical protein
MAPGRKPILRAAANAGARAPTPPGHVEGYVIRRAVQRRPGERKAIGLQGLRYRLLRGVEATKQSCNGYIFW